MRRLAVNHAAVRLLILAKWFEYVVYYVNAWTSEEWEGEEGECREVWNGGGMYPCILAGYGSLACTV